MRSIRTILAGRRASCMRNGAVLMVTLVVAASCGQEGAPLQADASAADASLAKMEPSAAPFKVWHQGFNHNTAGWYDASTPGDLGWCGSIEQRDRLDPVRPSAGRGYAVVSGGPCNEFWTGLGVPYAGPYAPGPDRALYSDAWPRADYVTELDIHLDPAWSGTFAGALAPNTLVDIGATLRDLRPAEGGVFLTRPHYFVPVETVEGERALSIFGHRVTQPGWYTFRFLVGARNGEVRVDFELRGRHGRTLLVESSLQPYELVGPARIPVEGPVRTTDHGSGHIWFLDVAPGLELPIDEHRVRPGR